MKFGSYDRTDWGEELGLVIVSINFIKVYFNNLSLKFG